jgi:hypothetical protein
MGVGGECDALATLLLGMTWYPLYRKEGGLAPGLVSKMSRSSGAQVQEPFPGKSDWTLKLSFHLYLTPGLEMNGAVLVFPQYAVMV